VEEMLSQLDLSLPKCNAGNSTKMQQKLILWLDYPRAESSYFGKAKTLLMAETKNRKIKCMIDGKAVVNLAAALNVAQEAARNARSRL
jgi:hypothetical protein